VGGLHGGRNNDEMNNDEMNNARFYPDFSGVVRSRNFYPVPPMASEDGIAAVALGMGREVVEGGKCMTFCPRYPRNLVQFSTVKDILSNSQSEFWALEMNHSQEGNQSPTRVPAGKDRIARDPTVIDPLTELREARFS